MPTQILLVHLMQAWKACRICVTGPNDVVRVRRNKAQAVTNRRTSTTSREERWLPLQSVPKTSVLSDKLNSAGPCAPLFCFWRLNYADLGNAEETRLWRVRQTSDAWLWPCPAPPKPRTSTAQHSRSTAST